MQKLVPKVPDVRSARNLRGARVLLRASLNVPLRGGAVINDFRIARTLESVSFLREAGAKVVMMGHIGRSADETLEPVFRHLEKHLPLSFAPRLEEAPARIESLHAGDVILLENLRRHEEEIKNDEAFARKLAALGDIYVNDAFSDSHRAHASVVGVPRYLESYAGLSLQSEIEHLSTALSPAHPALFILAGAKFETKVPLIRKFLDLYDRIFIGGALANDALRARGLEVGRSLVSSEPIDIDDVVAHERVMLPQDLLVERAGARRLVLPQNVEAEDCIYDAGPKTLEALLEAARAAAFVLWNGPLGNYERGYSEQTEALAKGLAELDATTIVGGGDTVASIARLNLAERYSFISTGGGAMLEFLEQGTLPGIEALRRES